MKIKKLHIENYKSLVNVEINEPNPFTVFVGPNGSGKSNIFESLEFLNYSYFFSPHSAVDIFGMNNIVSLKNQNGIKDKIDVDKKRFNQEIIISENTLPNEINITLETVEERFNFNMGFGFLRYIQINQISEESKNSPDYTKYIHRFSRVFVGNSKLRKQNTFLDTSLNIDASNLESVLKRLLSSEEIKSEIIDWLQIFVPEFENIEIHTSSLSGNSELAVYEKSFKQPLTKNLISDGTYNILALLTAVFQSSTPQFLCIEEPENGLHPYVIRELVRFLRQVCEEKGHYIWLNTHSQTLVDELKPHEIILVDKKDGATQIKQFTKETNLHGLKMDFAWLSNSLGGGVPW